MLYSNLEVAKAEQLLKSLLSRKPKIEALLNQCIVPTEKEKGNTVCVDDEKIVLPSVAAIDSESSNKATEIGEAFQIAGDPLLCVNLRENTTRKLPNVNHVQLGTNCNIEDIFDLLFPARNESQAPNSTVSEVMTNPDATSSSDCSDQPKILTVPCSEVSPPSEQNLQQVNWDLFQEVSDFLKLIGSENNGTTSTVAQKVKVILVLFNYNLELVKVSAR